MLKSLILLLALLMGTLFVESAPIFGKLKSCFGLTCTASDPSRSIEQKIWELNSVKSTLQSEAVRAMKMSENAKRKAAGYHSQDRDDFARVHAESAIRRRNLSLQLAESASKIEKFVSRIEFGLSHNQISTKLQKFVTNTDWMSMNHLQLNQVLSMLDGK